MEVIATVMMAAGQLMLVVAIVLTLLWGILGWLDERGKSSPTIDR